MKKFVAIIFINDRELGCTNSYKTTTYAHCKECARVYIEEGLLSKEEIISLKEV